QSKTICSGQNVNYDVTLSPAGQPVGTTYSWAAPVMSDASVQGSAGVAVAESAALTITDILTNTSGSPITATYTITPTSAGGCVGASVPVVITVNPIPVGVAASPTVCSDAVIGAAGVLTTTGTSVSAANFTIATNPNGLTQSAGTISAGVGKNANELIDDAWTNTTGANVNVIYTVTPFSSVGCAGLPFVIQVTVQPEPVSGPVVAATVCSDTPTAYNLVTPGASTYTITTNSNGLAQSAGTVSAGTNRGAAELADDQWTNTNNAFASINVIYTVTPISAAGCAGDPFTVTVPVKPEPLGVNHTASICSNSPVNYNLQTTNVNGLGNGMPSTFSWVVPVDNPSVTGESLVPQSTALIGDVLVNPTGVDQLVVYQVVPTGSVSLCTGNMFTISVTVKPSPIGVNQSVTTCSDVSPNYNLLNNIAILGNNVGSTFSWVAASNANVTGESTSSVIGPRITDIITNLTNAAEIVTYTVTPTGVNGCVGANFSIQVTVEPEPVGANATAPAICSGNPVNYSLQGNVNLGNALPSNFLWTATANPNVTGESTFTQTTPTITDILVNTTFVVQTVQYTVVPSGVNLCTGNAFTILVDVYPSAKISAGPDMVICSSQTSVSLAGVTTFAPNGVSWSTVVGGPGSYSPSNLVDAPDYTHSAAPPLDGFVTQTLVLTALDPDGVLGPCLVVRDTMKLRINGLPFINITGLPATLAENKPPVAVNTNRVSGTFFISAGSALPPQYVNGGVDEVLFDPALAQVNAIDTLYYYWQDPVTLCKDTVYRTVFVSPVTVIDYGMEYDCGTPGIPGVNCIPIARDVATNEFRFCSNSGLIRLKGAPPAPNGLPAGTNFAAVPTVYDPTGAILQAKISSVSNQWYLDTQGLPSGDYLLQYNYQDNFPPFNQSTPVTYGLKVYAAPNAQMIVPANNCNTAGVTMDGSSSAMLTPNPFGGSISQHLWNFGDLTAPGSGVVVTHPYPAAGTYVITLTVITSDLCRDTDVVSIQVGAPPIVNFDWSAICTNDLTTYQDLTNPGISTIVAYTWDFGDGDILTGPAGGTVPVGTHGGRTTGTFKDPQHNFTSTGSYPTTLTVATNDACTNFLSRTVNILTGGAPVAPTPLAPYQIDFNSAPGSWIAEGLVTSTVPAVVISPISWRWDTPAGTSITLPAGDKAWWTGNNQVVNGQPSYFNLESSVVNGPCFDLTNLTRPMIEFDYWSDAERNLDGAVVQYSTNGGLNWTMVGPASVFSGTQRDQGINWYDPFALIVSDPGQQVKKWGSSGSYGWTDKSQKPGDLTGWKRAKFNLDMVPVASRSQVRIRIAFSSNDQNAPGNTFDGFAFDNVKVGEKERRVLVENFTNSPTVVTLDQQWISLQYANQVAARGTTGSDFYYMNYHISLPTPDPLNLENPVDPGARSLYMGVSKSPTTIMDGIIDGVKFVGDFTDLDAYGIEADRRALVAPQFSLQLDTLATGNNNTISVRLVMTANKAHTDPLLAQVVLIEDQTGLFKNVVRKQLLGADGRTITQTFAIGDSRTEQADNVTINVPITNPGQLSLLAYVQNKNTREIYQSIFKAAPFKRGEVVVGLEDPKNMPTTLSGITMYPNPANGKVFLGVPADQSTEGFNWRLIDQRGVTVKSGDFNDLINNAREIPVGELANGMYIMQLTGPGGSVVHRKLMVMNRN
ncbi:MAG: PKD domain-containing protein, partial [Cyclobacteriaceae bacterium]|nr:PKD domain-containing protein [Cyclobacteriaceae bacterium]